MLNNHVESVESSIEKTYFLSRVYALFTSPARPLTHKPFTIPFTHHHLATLRTAAGVPRRRGCSGGKSRPPVDWTARRSAARRCSGWCRGHCNSGPSGAALLQLFTKKIQNTTQQLQGAAGDGTWCKFVSKLSLLAETRQLFFAQISIALPIRKYMFQFLFDLVFLKIIILSYVYFL